MRAPATFRLATSVALGTLLATGAAGAWAQSAWNGGGSEVLGQSTAMAPMGSTMSRDEVNTGAMAAARPVNTEAIGQSTVMPALLQPGDGGRAQADALAAAHSGGNSEAIGQSTALPMPGM